MALEEIKRRQFAEPDRALVQDQVIALVQAELEGLLEAYAALPGSFGGRYVNSDMAKELFQQYAESRETRGRYDAAVHNGAAVLAAEQFRRQIVDLSDPERVGALFLTGMPGSGKSTALMGFQQTMGREKFAPEQRVVFEGQMSTPATSIEKVGQALQAGLRPTVVAVMPSAEAALANTLKRFQEFGRGATIAAMSNIHEGLPASLRELNREFGDRLNIAVLDWRVRSIPVRLDGEAGIIAFEKELENGSVRNRLTVEAERLRDSGAIDDDCYRQCVGLAPYGQHFDNPSRSIGNEQEVERGRELPTGGRQAPILDRSARLEADRPALSDLELVNRCIRQLNEAVEVEDIQKPSWAEMVATANNDLSSAADRPAILAAFADSFSHPQMVAARLAAPTPDNLGLAIDELSRIRAALVDKTAAAEMLDAVEPLQRLDGPSPWDTFYADPGDRDGALMPLHGCQTPDVLGLGPIAGGDQQQSAGGQALFYPVGGYERFAEATSVVVAETLVDGLAIDAALQGDMTCAVIVASGADGVLDVCADVNQALVNRAAISAPTEPEALSLVAALGQSDASESEAVKRLAQVSPLNGTSLSRPSATPSEETASWSQMAPEAVLESVRLAQESSRRRFEEAAAEPDERLDFAEGFRDQVRELRASTRETRLARSLDTPAITAALTPSFGRGI